MKGAPKGPRRAFLLLAAVLLTVGGLARVFGNDAGYTDALFEPDYTIFYAPPEGPLAQAGFQAGDSVISVEGIPAVELGMYSRWPKSLSRGPGETLTMEVVRNGESVTGEIVYREQPASVWKLQFGSLLVFLAFLWAGVWTFLSVPSPHAGRMASLGLAAGLAVPSPHLGSWNGIAEHVHLAAMVLWTLLLFRFFLFFPRSKYVAEGHLTTALIYSPWVILLGCLTLELIFHPRYYHTFGGYTGILLFGYLVLTVVALIHSWVRTPRRDMGSSGMGWVLAGVGLGLGGLLFWALDALVFQGFSVPGSNWAPVLFGVIPVGMALAVRKASL